MILDAALPPVSLNEVPEIARAAQETGFNALWTSETIHNPFLPCSMIAEHSQSLNFGTAIAVAFARSPTTLAYTAWDLSQVSGGRFILGLGTQVKAHIERRFGMPWPESPVNKLRQQIEAMRALWDCWQNGTPLRYNSEAYRLSLMSPFFDPGRILEPDIPVYIAGVNQGLARLAGEVADGFLVHPFHSVAYLREVILPAIRNGMHTTNRKPGAVTISATVFGISGPEEEAFARSQLAFYASTPSYRAVMAHHGWEATAEKLSALAAHQQWGEMPGLITSQMLDVFACRVPAGELGPALLERYGGLVQRVTLYKPFLPGQQDGFWRELVKSVMGV